MTNDPVNWIDAWGLKKIFSIGDMELQWHTDDHGGPHWQLFDKFKKTIGRFRKDGSGIPHMGKTPVMPGKVLNL